MSASLAAARKRRGVPVSDPIPSNTINVQSPSQQPPGLTLPQVIALVDKRLLVLEAFMNEQKDVQPLKQMQQEHYMSNDNKAAISTDSIKHELEAIAEEFNDRYELLATEMQNIKDIVMKLQSYTMEVNKTLMEERIRILSDIEDPDNEEITA